MPKILTMLEFQSRFNSCAAMIKACHMDSTESTEYIKKYVYTELNRTIGKIVKRKVYNENMRGFCTGLKYALLEDFYKNHLEFCYIVNNVIYSTDKNSTHKSLEEIYACADSTKLLNNAVSGHMWKGTDKFFYK